MEEGWRKCLRITGVGGSGSVRIMSFFLTLKYYWLPLSLDPRVQIVLELQFSAEIRAIQRHEFR